MKMDFISFILGLSIDELVNLKWKPKKIISRVGRIRIWSVEGEFPGEAETHCREAMQKLFKGVFVKVL